MDATLDQLIRLAAMQTAIMVAAQQAHCGCRRTDLTETAWACEKSIRDFIAADHPDTLSDAERERRAIASWGVRL